MNTASPLPLHEPLAALAAFAFDWAHCLCDPESGCLSYHRAWSMVRHLEANGAFPAGGDFFGKALRGLARGNRIRILLSGSADTGLAALVLQALRPHGIVPEVVLVDRCLTTLEQNRLFARHAGFDLQTFQMDARELNIAPVDAIVAHSFLGLFAPGARQGVVDMWARNLAPTGRVLISNRLSVGPSAPRTAPDADALAQRKSEMFATAQAQGYSVARAASIAEAAEALWQIRLGYPQMTEDDLLEMLKNAGLAVVQMNKDSSGVSVSPLIMQTDAKRRHRAEIIAAHVG